MGYGGACNSLELGARLHKAWRQATELNFVDMEQFSQVKG